MKVLKEMRWAEVILAFSIILALTLTISSGAGGEYIYIKDITMRLSEGNAIFELNYSLETFTRLYVLALGCSYIEPDLRSILGNYSTVKVIRAGPDNAALLVSDAGKYNGGYYLFDSRPLGTANNPLRERISKFTVVYPEGRARTFFNVTSTQNVFCEAKMPSNNLITPDPSTSSLSATANANLTKIKT
jgi:hypothetical protein